MSGGAAGFLLKDAPAASSPSAIRRAMAGERIVDPGLAAAALSEGDSPLTAREQEVLAAVARARDGRRSSRRRCTSRRARRATTCRRSWASSAPAARIEALRVAEEKGWL